MTEQAAEVAMELATYLQEHRQGTADKDVLLAFVDRLTLAGGETPLDALALSSWAQGLLTMALMMMPDDPQSASRFPRHFVEVAHAMMAGATEALEKSTGVPADRFSGDVHVLH